MTPFHVPDPGTAHADLVEAADQVRDTIATRGLMPLNFVEAEPIPPVDWARALDGDPTAMPYTVRTLVIHRAHAPAAFVGAAFLWQWEVAVDELGRWITTDARPLYLADEIRRIFNAGPGHWS